MSPQLSARDVFFPVDTPEELRKCRYGVVIVCHGELAFIATATTKGIGDSDLVLDVPDYEARKFWGLEERSQFVSRFIYAYWTGSIEHEVRARVPAGKLLKLREALHERLHQHAEDPFGPRRIMSICHPAREKDLHTPRADDFKVGIHEAAKAAARQRAGDRHEMLAARPDSDTTGLR